MHCKNCTVKFVIFLTIIWILNLGGCATTLTPPPVLEPPAYSKVPHPEGTDLGDLMAIFTDRSAPQGDEFIKDCDADFRALKKSTDSVDEVTRGVAELVQQNPVHYHWCFYAKLLDLESKLKSGTYVDERQKEALNAYEFLTPVARAFNSEFYESRYLRWATHKYQQISEWIFYRRLELTPKGTSELVEATKPLDRVRTPSGKESVLQKYHLGTQTSFSVGGPPEVSVERPLPSALPLPSPLVTTEESSEFPKPEGTVLASSTPSPSPEVEPTYSPMSQLLPTPSVSADMPLPDASPTSK